MSSTAPQPKPPEKPNFYLSLAVTMLLFFALGTALQEIRWRGAFGGLLASPVQTPDQQLKLAEVAFKEGNDAVALQLFKTLADQKNVVAEYWLAHMTELGLGMGKNIPDALSLYEKAVAGNSLPAELRLGEIYMNGDLVTPDYAKAFDLLKRAALQGSPRAAMLFGQMYRFGLGVAADPIESFAWSEVAVIEGLGFAKIEREAAFTSMTPADRATAAARSAVLLAEIRKQPASPKK